MEKNTETLETARTFRPPHEAILRGAEAINDLLVMLNVNPDERGETPDQRSIAEILAGAVLGAAGPAGGSDEIKTLLTLELAPLKEPEPEDENCMQDSEECYNDGFANGRREAFNDVAKILGLKRD